jgi:hypothetical protein
MPLPQRLLKDLKASAPKTGVLGLLLLVGLFFWVPPLLQVFTGSTAAGTPASAASPESATTSMTTDSQPAGGRKPRDSAAMRKLFHSSPLFQPANIDDLPRQPFGINDELFPLPVLFAEDSEAEPRPAPIVEAPKVPDKVQGLLLKSTIVGPQRRAAWINNRLFQEGQTVFWNGQELRLSAVQRKSVTLTDGSHEWQLTLEDARGAARQNMDE